MAQSSQCAADGDSVYGRVVQEGCTQGGTGGSLLVPGWDQYIGWARASMRGVQGQYNGGPDQ